MEYRHIRDAYILFLLVEQYCNYTYIFSNRDILICFYDAKIYLENIYIKPLYKSKQIKQS